ncbi:hypothetical protein RZO85_06120 [Raoultella ornithinolytica]|uniref:hypothetical protein n=1 Tax=Klebsiella/Raoultella group TaxID=2890311 RepID=UPI00292B6ACE|nr:hypothetical protein [Raoultella ornithinolytica]MDV0599299.1 hypothetical protein [Raoultella ornithinolytica]HDH7803695.1 hypothetical protein [Raoultella ornithinolytica]
MKDKNLEWVKEFAQTGSEVYDLAKDVGVPGIGLTAKIIQLFLNKHLQKRFDTFISNAEVDEDLLSKISSSETYSNCFYATLETVRQTHSKIGLVALALIYKDHWNDEQYLIAAMRAFSQVSDATINAFICLYEEMPEDKNYLILKVQKDNEGKFHEFYNEAVELIQRNFFVLSTGTGMLANGPIQGMKWFHTESYYKYCKSAKAHIG